MATLGRPVRVGLVHPLLTWLQALVVLLEPLADVEVFVFNVESRWVRHAVARGEVDVVVMRLDAETGVEEILEMRQARADVGVVVIGDGNDSSFITHVVRAGARGYLAEDCSVEDLHRGIRGVAEGHTWLAPAQLSLLVDGLLSSESTSEEQDGRLAPLSPREREILDCLARGMRRQEIADLLFISPNTVRTHINHLIKKLNVHSALAAVAITKGDAESYPADPDEPRVPAARLPDEAEAVSRLPGR